MECCSVCDEKYNNTRRKKITCRCEFHACKTCIKTYILSKTENIHCMECKVAFDRKFMIDNFDKKFISKEYREHRENILLEKEIGMMQATQVYVERDIEIEKTELKLAEDNALLTEFYYKIQENKNKLSFLKNNAVLEKKEFIRKCPKDDCHGFLSSSLKCKLCEYYSCAECKELKGKTTDERNDHVCKNEILESVKMLEKDSKNCPKCSSLIFKINGCNSIFCIECHASFNWVTLRLETGPIHNPEYFDMLKKKGFLPRNPLDIQCGRELDNRLVNDLMVKLGVSHQRRILINYQDRNQTHKTKCRGVPIIDIIRKVIEVKQLYQPAFLVRNTLDENLNLRIAYMRNFIDKEYFKKTIQRQEKDTQKKNEIYNIIGLYISSMTELFYRIKEEEKGEHIVIEMNNLRIYINECLVTVSEVYKCKIYYIDSDYNFI